MNTTQPDNPEAIKAFLGCADKIEFQVYQDRNGRLVLGEAFNCRFFLKQSVHKRLSGSPIVSGVLLIVLCAYGVSWTCNVQPLIVGLPSLSRGISGRIIRDHQRGRSGTVRDGPHFKRAACIK